MSTLSRTPIQIGHVIRRKRQQLKLSQSELAERTGLRQSTISTLETSSQDSKISTLCAILPVLNLDIIFAERQPASMDDFEDIF